MLILAYTATQNPIDVGYVEVQRHWFYWVVAILYLYIYIFMKVRNKVSSLYTVYYFLTTASNQFAFNLIIF